MKKALVFTCVIGVLTIAVRSTMAAVGVPSEENEVDAKVIAVYIRADWDSASQAITPVFENLVNRFDEEPVLFVTLDMTNATTRHQARLLRTELRLDDVWGAGIPVQGTLHFLTAGEERTDIEYLQDATSFENVCQALRSALEKVPEKSKDAAPPF